MLVAIWRRLEKRVCLPDLKHCVNVKLADPRKLIIGFGSFFANMNTAPVAVCSFSVEHFCL